VAIAASAGWRSARPRLPLPAQIVVHEALEAQRNAVAQRNARREAQADFERSLPSRVTLLRRELTEPGLRVSRVASVDPDAKTRLFYIDGEVKSHGSYALTDGLTLRDAIAKAGGLTDRADAGRLTIYRAIDGKARGVAATLDDLVRADDVIDVPKRPY
jgi:protein involved in polysaccharide export with SLBB domain